MNKIFSLLTVAALAVTTFYGDMPSKMKSSDPCACLEQGMPLSSDQKCYPAAYNAPAGISVRDGWDFDVFASFIYWHVSQENMNSAVQLPVAGVSDGTFTSPTFNYEPGFKVGFGFNTGFDEWNGWVEYTWMHQKTYHASHTDIASPFTTAGWLIVDAASDLPEAATFASAKWKMHLDMVDAVFSRPYYEGKRITLAPYGGMRGLWIRQNYKVLMNDSTNLALGNVNKVVSSSHSWAVGPVIGALSHWMLGAGFRFEGKSCASLLYTRYKKVGQVQHFVNTSSATIAHHSHIRDLNVLRPMFDLGVGLGWGSYLDSQSYYFDLSVRYDFNLFWDQNVMAEFVNGMNATPGTNGNLYMHGLTASMRLDF